MKVAEDAAMELPLEDERLTEPRKHSRHVVVALNHMRKRREVLCEQTRKLKKELDDIDIAIMALDPK